MSRLRILGAALAVLHAAVVSHADNIIGCGTLIDPVPCGTCLPNTGGCSCASSYCNSSTVECPPEPVGYTNCPPGLSCTYVMERFSRCKRRMMCKNSLAEDLGYCAADNYCVATMPYVEWGDYRTTYYTKDVPCHN